MKHFSNRQIHFHKILTEYLNNQDNKLNLDTEGTSSLAAWFLGPKAENRDFFQHLLLQGLDAHCNDRNNYHSHDPKYISEYRKDNNYDQSLEDIHKYFTELVEALQSSVPFFSYRYQAHMNWDLTMPGLLGYFAALLYNQNNVALEASPVTSQLEALVGNDLCEMLGYPIPPKEDKDSIRPWGHVTCDGSIANLEAMWAARNLKYYPISMVQAIINDPKMEMARELYVQYCGQQRKLCEMNTWELLNINIDETLDLANKIHTQFGIDIGTINDAIEPYLIQSTGIIEFHKNYLSDVNYPVLLGTATKHYSWPKNAAALGIGKDSFINIHINDEARMDINHLEEKINHFREKKYPILMVVVVLGSTEESAVDPLKDVLDLRDKYRKKGMEFAVHVDAAWGGYFASTLRGDYQDDPCDYSYDLGEQCTPILSMSDYVTEQYENLGRADTITVDPHKAGYIPYPAGALCYRNKKMRNLIAFLASEVYHSESLDANMGVFGIEGSKPGAAAAAVYLSHKVIRPDRSGYGKILGKALFNSKRFFASVITMAEDNDPFVVVPVQKIPAEKHGEDTKPQLDYIKYNIVPKQNNELIQDQDAMHLLTELGSDQIIITYGLNFKNQDGSLNTDPDLANQFMHAVFEKLSIKPDSNDVNNTPLIITTSEFDPEVYGNEFVQTYMERLGIAANCADEAITMNFISSTTMCPWLTATEEGNFIPTLTAAFREAIISVVHDYYSHGSFYQGSSKVSTLRLKSLKCINSSERDDEAYFKIAVDDHESKKIQLEELENSMEIPLKIEEQFNHKVVVQLMDYDFSSSDDSLGKATFTPMDTSGKKYLSNKDQGSCYILYFEIR